MFRQYGSRPRSIPPYHNSTSATAAAAGDPLLPASREDLPCVICSDKYREVKHGHVSSEWLRRQAVENKQSDFFCMTCRAQHSTKIKGGDKRRKILLSDSTLHNAVTHLAVNTDFHLDIETIPGAKVWDLERVLAKLYLRDPIPVDVVLVGGLNQVKMQETAAIMASYRSVCQAVENHSWKFAHTKPSTICITTLPFPPKFVTFKREKDSNGNINPDYPAHLTPDTNLFTKISELNRQIDDLNRQNRVVVPFKMMMYGIKVVQGQGRFKHRWNQWFEKEDEKKLHLTHEKRAEVIQRMQTYFIRQTEW